LRQEKALTGKDILLTSPGNTRFVTRRNAATEEIASHHGLNTNGNRT
jgi:hypothetical protein